MIFSTFHCCQPKNSFFFTLSLLFFNEIEKTEKCIRRVMNRVWGINWYIILNIIYPFIDQRQNRILTVSTERSIEQFRKTTAITICCCSASFFSVQSDASLPIYCVASRCYTKILITIFTITTAQKGGKKTPVSKKLVLLIEYWFYRKGKCKWF